MTRYIKFFIFSISFTACSPQTKDMPKIVKVSDDSSSIKGASQSINSTFDTIISKRLFTFAKLIDSAGYSCDTTRAKKAHAFLSNKNRINFKGYFFYNTRLENTALDLYKRDTLYANSFPINLKAFNKVSRIVTYFFVVKTAEVKDGEKWFTDGFLEEWKFPDSLTAKATSIDLRTKAGPLITSDAFICRKDNYMYVFRSRNTGFMYTIAPFIKTFSTNNGAVYDN